jgi:WD40 repeat protein
MKRACVSGFLWLVAVSVGIAVAPGESPLPSTPAAPAWGRSQFPGGPANSAVVAAKPHGPAPTIAEKVTPLGQLPTGVDWKTLSISPDSAHLAFKTGRDGKWAVDRDDVPGKQYDAIGKSRLTFSPDSKRLAYVAASGRKWYVVVDGVEGKGYDDVSARLVFSPDSRHLAYAASSGGKWFSVVDGTAGKPCRAIGRIVFSPDSKHAAYDAWNGGKLFVVVDGVEGKAYDGVGTGTICFSPDNRRMGYFAKSGRQWFLVLNGVEGKAYDATAIGPCTFSPDGSHVAYSAERRGKYVAVVDGTEGSPYEWIDDFTFSPDSRHLAFRCVASNKARVRLDGKECPLYDAVWRGSLTFSRDGKRFGYEACRNGKWMAVIDGAEGKSYVSAMSLAFSPDSRHVAFAAALNNKWLLVVDGVEGKPYDRMAVETLAWSPGSRQVAVEAAETGKGWFVASGGGESMPVAGFARGSALVFDGPQSLHSLAWRNHQAIRLEFDCSVGVPAVAAVPAPEAALPISDNDPNSPNFVPGNPPVRLPALAPARGTYTYHFVKGKVVREVVAEKHPATVPNVFEVLGGASGPEPEQSDFSNAKPYLAKTREVSLGKMLPGADWKSIVVGSTENFVGYAARVGDKWEVCQNGIHGKEYDRIQPGSLIFSPNGQSLLYAAESGGKWRAVWSGNEGPAYDEIHSLKFSPDGKQVTYAGRKGNAWIITGGSSYTESAPWDEIMPGTPQFNPQGLYTCYAARQGGQWFVMNGGNQMGPFAALGKDGIRFSPFHRPYLLQLAFVARKENRNGWTAVIDGYDDDPGGYDQVTVPVFNYTGRLYAYAAKRDGKWFAKLYGKNGAVVDSDGKRYELASKPYDLVGDFTYSPDGRQVVYIAALAGKQFVVRYDQEGPQYDAVGSGSLLFSPDGGRFAYTAKQGGKWLAVIDDKAGKPYDRIGALIFSADGKRAAYPALSDGKWHAVADGAEGPACEELGAASLTFSADGQHVFYAARNGAEWSIVLDGIESRNKYDAFFVGDHMFVFDRPNQCHTLGRRQGDILWIGLERNWSGTSVLAGKRPEDVYEK